MKQITRCKKARQTKLKYKRHSRKEKYNKSTRKRGGGLFATAQCARNVRYIYILEKRLVNKCNDYDWVQDQRKQWMYFQKEKKDYD